MYQPQRPPSHYHHHHPHPIPLYPSPIPQGCVSHLAWLVLAVVFVRDAVSLWNQSMVAIAVLVNIKTNSLIWIMFPRTATVWPWLHDFTSQPVFPHEGPGLWPRTSGWERSLASTFKIEGLWPRPSGWKILTSTFRTKGFWPRPSEWKAFGLDLHDESRWPRP